MTRHKPSQRSATPGKLASRKMTASEELELTGCDIAGYEGLLAAKVAKVRALLGEVCRIPAETEVFRSPPTNFRQRVNFRVWHEPDDRKCSFVMYSQQSEEQT